MNEIVGKEVAMSETRNLLSRAVVTLQRKHPGHMDELSLFILSGYGARKKRKSKLIHIVAVGPTGTGKSDTTATVRELFGGKEVIGASAKSPLYLSQEVGGLPDGAPFVIDEGDNLSPEMYKLLRGLTNPDDKSTKYDTVVRGKALSLVIKEVMTIWITCNDGLSDAPVLDRMWVVKFKSDRERMRACEDAMNQEDSFCVEKIRELRQEIESLPLITVRIPKLRANHIFGTRGLLKFRNVLEAYVDINRESNPTYNQENGTVDARGEDFVVVREMLGRLGCFSNRKWDEKTESVYQTIKKLGKCTIAQLEKELHLTGRVIRDRIEKHLTEIVSYTVTAHNEHSYYIVDQTTDEDSAVWMDESTPLTASDG